MLPYITFKHSVIFGLGPLSGSEGPGESGEMELSVQISPPRVSGIRSTPVKTLISMSHTDMGG